MIKSLYPKFQEWSRTGSVWVISDTHFDDSDCKIMDPEWISPEKHISILKNKILPTDTLIHLGDVGNASYLSALRCRKVLITGNHDKGVSLYEKKTSVCNDSDRSANDRVFDEVYNGPLFISDRILLSHEPIYGLEDFCVNIHGHVHCRESIMEEPGHVNLASDVAKYRPFNLGKAIEKGLLKDVENYHKLTVEKARENPIKKMRDVDDLSHA